MNGIGLAFSKTMLGLSREKPMRWRELGDRRISDDFPSLRWGLTLRVKGLWQSER